MQYAGLLYYVGKITPPLALTAADVAARLTATDTSATLTAQAAALGGPS